MVPKSCSPESTVCQWRVASSVKGRFLSCYWNIVSLLQGAPFPAFPPSSLSMIVAWEPPLFFKLNFDGTVKGDLFDVGIIISNHEGHLQQAKAFNLGYSSVLIAEATALHQGLKVALQIGIWHILVEGDNLTVINSLNGTWAVPWKIASIFYDCKILLSHFASFNVCNVFRNVNRAADWIANVRHLIPSSFNVSLYNNSMLSSKIVFDTLGMIHLPIRQTTH